MKPEEFLEFIKKRRSIRKFLDTQITDEEIKMIIEAGRWAPSAENTQPWEFIVIENKNILENIAKTGYAFALRRAPMSIAIVTKMDDSLDPSETLKPLDRLGFRAANCSLAAMNMVLMAWALNIGTCFVADFDRNYAKKILDLSEHDYLLFIIAIGYIKGEVPKLAKRKNFDDICYFIK